MTSYWLKLWILFIPTPWDNPLTKVNSWNMIFVWLWKGCLQPRMRTNSIPRNPSLIPWYWLRFHYCCSPGFLSISTSLVVSSKLTCFPEWRALTLPALDDSWNFLHTKAGIIDQHNPRKGDWNTSLGRLPGCSIRFCQWGATDRAKDNCLFLFVAPWIKSK